jgi:hypothetical protein
MIHSKGFIVFDNLTNTTSVLKCEQLGLCSTSYSKNSDNHQTTLPET